MDQLTAFNLLLDIIKTGKKHPQYDRTVELAKDYRALSTGVGLDDKLKKFSIGQSDAAFAVQKEITIHTTRSIISNLTHIYYRVPRSPGLKLGWSADSDALQQEFEQILDGFCEDGFNEYMEQRVKDLVELDPNTFIVTEFKSTDGTERAQPYPYEVPAENAVMFEYDIANLIYLVDKRTIKRLNSQGVETVCDQYTIYTKIGAVKVVQSPDSLGSAINLKLISELKSIPETFSIDTKSYEVIVPIPYNLEQVPARRVGYLQDKTNGGKSFVNMYDACVPFLLKMVKANSEMDVSFAKHVHPQKIQYVRACTNTGCQICEDGKYYTSYEDHQLCPICHGKGFTDVTQGGLEYLYFPFPQTKEEILDLSNIVHYVAVDIETPKMLMDYIDKMTELCRKTMFNHSLSNESVERKEVEIIYNESNRDDTLRPYAVNYSILYKHILTNISGITEIEITIVALVSKDFNMRGLAEWTTILQGLVLAGANDAIIASVQTEIMRSLHGDTEISQQYTLTQVLIPFQSMSKELRAIEVASLPRDDKYRVAAVYGNDIIKTMALENPLFWELAFTKQKEMFDAKVQERVQELVIKEPALPNFLPINENKPQIHDSNSTCTPLSV